MMRGDLYQRYKALIDDEEQTMWTICSHVASGGSLIELCNTWEVRYGDIAQWLRAGKTRSQRYQEAMADRSEWATERILLELKRIGMADIRQIYDEGGAIKPVNEWPDEVAGFVQSIEVVEEFEGSGKDRIQTGWNKKIKMWNKERALELLGKNLKLFLDRVDVSGKITLEDLITQSRDGDE